MTTILSDVGVTFASGNLVDIKVSIPTTGSYTIGDIVLESSSVNKVSGWKRATTGSAHVLNTDWLYFNMPASPQSMIRLQGSNGYGSSSTVIRRLTTVVTTQGTDITYTTNADTSVLGSVFTINTAGVYAISYSDQGSAVNFYGVTLNSAQLTTSINTLAAPQEVLVMFGNPVASVPGAGSWTGYLPAGSIVRPHTAAGAAGSFLNQTNFAITRVA
jgi:hypothetical protein